MRAIIIILLVLAGFGFVGYRVYNVLSYSQKVIADNDPATKGKQAIEHNKPQPIGQGKDKEEEKPIFYTLEEVTQNPLLQRTFYQESKGTLAGIVWRNGLVTAYTTDRRIIAHSQIKAVGQDWVLLKNGAYLRFPAPPPPQAPPPVEQPDQAPKSEKKTVEQPETM